MPILDPSYYSMRTPPIPITAPLAPDFIAPDAIKSLPMIGSALDEKLQAHAVRLIEAPQTNEAAPLFKDRMFQFSAMAGAGIALAVGAVLDIATGSYKAGLGAAVLLGPTAAMLGALTHMNLTEATDRMGLRLLLAHGTHDQIIRCAALLSQGDHGHYKAVEDLKKLILESPHNSKIQSWAAALVKTDAQAALDLLHDIKKIPEDLFGSRSQILASEIAGNLAKMTFEERDQAIFQRAKFYATEAGIVMRAHSEEVPLSEVVSSVSEKGEAELAPRFASVASYLLGDEKNKFVAQIFTAALVHSKNQSTLKATVENHYKIILVRNPSMAKLIVIELAKRVQKSNFALAHLLLVASRYNRLLYDGLRSEYPNLL